MKYIFGLFFSLLAILLFGCETTNNTFSTSGNFDAFFNKPATVGNVYAITGESSAMDSHSLVLEERKTHVTSIHGNEPKRILLQSDYLLSEILNKRNRIFDLLIIYHGNAPMQTSTEVTSLASGSSTDGGRNRTTRYIAKGDIIGTKDWAHPDYQEEWNRWAGITEPSPN